MRPTGNSVYNMVDQWMDDLDQLDKEILKEEAARTSTVRKSIFTKKQEGVKEKKKFEDERMTALGAIKEDVEELHKQSMMMDSDENDEEDEDEYVKKEMAKYELE